MLLRTMSIEDAGVVAALSETLGYVVSEAEVRARVASLAGSLHHGLFVAEDGAVRGWLHVEARHSLEAPPCAEIQALVVAADARRLGLGRALVEAALGWTRDQGLPSCRVRSNVVRDAAHEFYPALGFSRSKTQHVYVRAV